MENKINIAELLKDCPIGMELDCTVYDNVQFEGISDNKDWSIKISVEGYPEVLNPYGCISYRDYAKCVIFPKGKTTWKGFIPPCQFKDGDIVATTTGSWIGITEGGKLDSFIPTYCVIKRDDKFEAYFDKKEKWQFSRLATEEEKQKLFDAIKANGYKWNPQTKTLEKVLNKFDITTLIPFESRVLVRGADGDLWKPAIYGFSHPKGCYVVGGVYWKQCIPYEENKHLLGTTDDCHEFYKTWE